MECCSSSEVLAYIQGPDGTCFICLAPARWKALNLAPPRVEAARDGFLVARYAVRPAAGAAEEEVTQCEDT